MGNDKICVWGVGKERIFNQEERQLRILLSKGGAQAFGGVAFAIVLLRAFLIQDR